VKKVDWAMQDKIATAVIRVAGEWICELMAAEHQAVVTRIVEAGDVSTSILNTAEARRDVWHDRKAYIAAIAAAITHAATGDLDAARSVLPTSLRPRLTQLAEAVAAATSPPQDDAIKLKVGADPATDAKTLTFAAAVITIGTAPSNHIVVRGADVAATHVSIARIGKTIWLGNLHPDGNGVHLFTGSPITHMHTMVPGEWIRIGDTRIALVA
jgi:hypothetical protein